MSKNITWSTITQLPLEARNLVDLLSLQPGSTREGYTTGARADQSNVTLDGVDINNAQSGNAQVPLTTNNLGIGTLGGDRGDITSGPVLRLNAEAVEEFRVTTANEVTASSQEALINTQDASLGNNFIAEQDFGLDPSCSDTAAVPGFDPTWSNTQVFYAMQSRTPSNPCFSTISVAVPTSSWTLLSVCLPIRACTLFNTLLRNPWAWTSRR